jgi:hypothetical protein
MDIKQKTKDIVSYLETPISFTINRGFYYFTMFLIAMGIWQYTNNIFLSTIAICAFCVAFYFDQKLIAKRKEKKDE